MVLPEEVQIKEERLWRALDAQGYGSIIITRRDQYAWITAGADLPSATNQYELLEKPIILGACTS